MVLRTWQILASTSVLVLLAGCQGLPDVTAGSSNTSNPCSTSAVRLLVERFIDGFNRGDLAELDQLVYQRYGVYATSAPGERLNAQAHDRDNLMAYFAVRHQQNEHLQLISLDVTDTSTLNAGFWFRVTRRSDDGLPPTRYGGKGEVKCSPSPISLTVWSMSPEPW